MFEKVKSMLGFGKIGETEQTYDDVVAEMVNKEYERRKTERRPFELQWRLNIEFINGNQYVDIDTATNSLVEIPKLNWWQEREVFNQIATIYETRVARLTRQKPIMKTRPASSEDRDIASSKISSSILSANWHDQDMDETYGKKVAWLESCGTVFYKNTWNKGKGRIIHKELVPDDTQLENEDEEIKTENQDEQLMRKTKEIVLREGDVETIVCSPFEIYPDSCYRDNMKQTRSIIHARAYHVNDIYDMYGVEVEAEEVDVMTMQEQVNGLGGVGYSVGGFRGTTKTLKNHAIVKEYYERPSSKYPKGRFIVVVGKKAVYVGTLPYNIGTDNEPDLPFIRMTSIPKTGCFWGTSVVERCIPIQRRYNALRNRKAEYLNRVVIGQWLVEEGSIDDEEDLNDSPGQIIYYKKGYVPPQKAVNENLPGSFENELQTLNAEFTAISGTSELSRYSEAPSGVKSGVALSIANEQDDTRIGLTAQNLANGVVKLGKQWLRLYKQFAVGPRIVRLAGEGHDVEVMQWTSSDLRSDDVIVENSSALAETPAQRRQMVFDLMQYGLFNKPEINQFSPEGVAKILEMIELGNWETGIESDRTIQTGRAKKENRQLVSGQQAPVMDFDDHALHIIEHNRYRMSEEFEEIRNTPQGQQLEAMMLEHIETHRYAIQQEMMAQMMQQAQQQPQMEGAS